MNESATAVEHRRLPAHEKGSATGMRSPSRHLLKFMIVPAILVIVVLAKYHRLSGEMAVDAAARLHRHLLDASVGSVGNAMLGFRRRFSVPVDQSPTGRQK